VEELSQFWQQVVANKVAIWLVLTSTISAAAYMAALTPKPKNGSKIGRIRKVIDIFGGNWGFARNKTDK
jgi:hypothetical protein